MKKMYVAEYLPKSLVVGSRILIVLSVAVMVFIVSGFQKSLKQTAQLEAAGRDKEQVLRMYEEWMKEGNLCFEKEQYDEAAQYYRMVTELHPASAEAYLKLAEIFEYHKNYEEAKSVLLSCPEQIRNDDYREKMTDITKTMESLNQSIFVGE